MKPLSDTQRVILSQASQHEARLAPVPKLPKAAADAVVKSLLRNGLLAECRAPQEHAAAYGWRQDEADARIALRVTDDGLRAIGIEPEPAEDASTRAGDAVPAGAAPEPQSGAITSPGASPVAPSAPAPRPTVRDAAAAVLAAWDEAMNRASDVRAALREPIATLRCALARSKPARTPRDPAAARPPRQGTKQEAVLAMLRRPDGATVARIAEATGWAPHTVRGFLAGLKKKGVAVEVLERVRQVGPNKEGAKGSYTVYRVAA
jgi:hypothetical protein